MRYVKIGTVNAMKFCAILLNTLPSNSAIFETQIATKLIIRTGINI